MRAAILGADGQLGTALRQRSSWTIIAFGRSELDITDPDQVARQLEMAEPDLVINTAAYNLVDRAESEPELAFAVNALGPRTLARWCGRANVPMVHFSTDYVFSGDETVDSHPRAPWRESDLPQPGSVYAISKLAGEQFVAAECPKHRILRTCGLYGFAAGTKKGNFVETMLRLGRERGQSGQPLRVVHDHLCTPTFAADLAEATWELAATSSFGLFHATNAGETTWFDFAREIFQLENISVEVQPISASEYAAAARRPAFSVLATERLTRAIGRPMPVWQDALRRYLNARGAHPSAS